jgi:tetratricopeptide (TPR) repeat protein
MVMGHYIIGTSHFMNGDFPSAIESSKRAIQASSEPYYTQIPRTLLGMGYLQNGQYPEAEEVLQEVASFSEEFGAEAIGTPARMGLVVLSIVKGHMSQGLGVLEDIKATYWEDQSRFRYALSEYFLGKVYFEITRGTGPDRLFNVAKNLGFLLREVPFASRKAETHFSRLVEVSKKVGDKGLLGEAYLNLGLLYKEKKKTVKARECLSKAVRVFEECEIEVFLREAKQALEQQSLATK